MYFTRNIDIKPSAALYLYFDRIAHLSANLYNVSLFRERQLMTSAKKKEEDWSDHEREIRNEINAVGIAVPSSGVLSYTALNRLMKKTDNPDYRAEGLPRQTAQNVLRHAVRDLTSFFEASKRYKEYSSLFVSVNG